MATEYPVMARGPWREVVALFVRLGFTAFGGPAAHIAMMRQEVVTRRKWLSDAHFVDLLGAVNLIPGPNSTELGIYLGYLRAGWPGLIAAGLGFIGPAMLIVLGIAWAYVQFGALPAVGWFLYGIKPVVVAIIAQALWGLAGTVPRDWWLGLIGIAVLVGFIGGLNTVALLLIPGALGLLVVALRRRGATPAGMVALVQGHWLTIAGGMASVSLLTLFLNFLKIGAVLYGSGYVLLALLHDTFVAQLHWLTDRQLLDAISVGQFTPGPVFTTATFVGYLVGGVPGALVATLGIFLPAFVFVPLIHPLVVRLRRSPLLAGFLRGVNVAALALMAGVVVQLGHAALIDPLT
ncbi:MAG: chromate efflux transporter, partial [Ktedonobacterales bacterium]|nr:chromate efflux transporter [Ktedonobacterales bacterium]